MTVCKYCVYQVFAKSFKSISTDQQFFFTLSVPCLQNPQVKKLEKVASLESELILDARFLRAAKVKGVI